MKKHMTFLAAMLMVLNITKAQWITLGDNTYPLYADNIIYSIVTDIHGNVYAAGKFGFGDSVVQNYYVAKWTGDTAWVPLDTAGFKANSYIYALTTDASGNIYAAGAFTDDTVIIDGGSVYYYGNIYVAKYNGTAWSELGASGVSHVPNVYGSAISCIAADQAGNVYAAGEFTNSIGKYYVSKWNGSAWAELGAGANALNANHFINTIAIGPSGNVYAAGDFTDSSGRRYVAEWNGTTWGEMGTGTNALNANSPIRTITADISGHVFVAYQDTSSDFYVAQWNGSNWVEVGAGSTALHANNAINALATDVAGNLYAAGNFIDANLTQYVAMWNGNNWSEVGTGSHALNPNSYILSIATDTALNVYAGGYFTDGFGKYIVAEYDPNAQTPSGIGDMELSAIDAIDIIPNPTVANTKIVLSATTAAHIVIELYDMTGRKMKTIYTGDIQMGKNAFSFDANAVSPGVYLVRLSDGHCFVQKRFVKL